MSAEKEIAVLVPEPTVITLVTGEAYTLPAISWGREIRVMRVISALLKDVTKDGVFSNENATVADLVQSVLESAPDKITEAVSAITNKDSLWVEENLNIETIIQVLIPFLRKKQEAILASLQPYLDQMTETPTPA